MNDQLIRLLLLIGIIVCTMQSGSVAARVDTFYIQSEAMNKTVPAIVFVPSQNPESSERDFPVVYLLHGYGGSYLDWGRYVNLEYLSDKYQFILVCPDGSPNSWYLDSPLDSGSQYETFISFELIEWVDKTFPTINQKEGRAITGLSMGGHGSFYLAIRHPGRYQAAGNMSGMVDLTFTSQKYELAKKLGDYEQFPERWTHNSIFHLIPEAKGKQLKLLIDCGVDDDFIEMNRRLHHQMLELDIPHDYCERPGRHNWQYWSRSLEYHLLFFMEAFTKNR